MKIVILGSGTSVPHPKRTASAHWLATEKTTLLLDCGADAAHRMAAHGLAWEDLGAIWLSHFHLDHIGGLLPFLFGTKYAPQTQSRRHPLVIYGPRGTALLLQRLDRANDYDLLDQPFPLEVREVKPDEEFEIGPQLTARAFKTPHTDESLGLRLTDERGRIVVYTSDTGFDEKLATEAQGASLLIIECSFRRDKPVATHLEFNEAAEIAKRAGADKTVLVHLYPEWDDAETNAINGLRLADDGLEIEL
ncbi:MBL fold metallo-hydrolase [Pyrinomonas sp.]|uniref:MBL fold metallo-hydrolase n=1 Tax=Pyrinomonas sp. TaxID=2080306 RepID=UPI00332669AD